MGKPRLIIIIRHAQSEGNKDKTIHQRKADHKVELTEEGHRQALGAGEKLRALLQPDDSLHFFISPYTRTRQTTEGILNGLCSNDPVPSPFQRSHIKVYEEPRLREQDFGNFQPGTDETEKLWRERAQYGHFFYRIPNGESGADVYDRVSSFNGSLWRRFSEDSMASVAIIVTHGLCSRVFLMAWYHYSVEFFEDLRNIDHCEFLVMKQRPNGKYELRNQLRRWTDLKRERAAANARKNSISTPTEPIPNIPVRQWSLSASAYDSPGASSIPRPSRKNTVDLFKDDPETIEEDGGNKRNPNASPVQRRGSKGASGNREGSRSRIPSSSTLRNSFSNLSVDSGRKSSNLSDAKPYLGRDGGGTRSGQGSPFGSDDELEVESPKGTPQAQVPLSSSPEALRKAFPGSLARALRGELDDPDRRLADALGDQSDAEVDEADLEIGTKGRITDEMEQILEEERRERSSGASTF
ncbi:hypothetical protein H2200_001191 [Cladophialophora chaetospira]|uniref:Phosphoglycerate mutase family domain protein n=1 Tax=Cladophialophora chaetospira TaxID=386627 RepID=A0AA38XKE1_9EURO|nr:hypothetical protein H2200_001191 [Cladophialophora chaetospira]